MASVAAAIVGAPLTMIFLVLEGTGDFPLTVGVIIGVVTASTIARLSFGYSFSTWRFHQRGLTLRGAHDVGWISDLTVARMMRSDPSIVSETMTVASLRNRFPIGSVKVVFVTDESGHFKGLFDLARAHDSVLDTVADTTSVATLAVPVPAFLVPGQNVRDALRLFEQAQTETLPVLASRSEPLVVGYLTEAFALRRYMQEMEQRRSAELGEQDLFSIGTPRA
jgi:CIC family chloride channel protein